MNINILYEDPHIIVCEKPIGIPTQSDKTHDFDMVNQLKNYIHNKNPEKGQPYIGLIHRLDRPVGGVMLFAKTPFASKELSEQIRKKAISKRYLAVTTSDLSNELGNEKALLTDYLQKDGRTNSSKICKEKDINAKKAELNYKVLEVITKELTAESTSLDPHKIALSLLDIELLTGRHHQIRVQMASRHNPLWADTKYNPRFDTPDKVEHFITDSTHKNWLYMGLFAYKIEFVHPKTKKKMQFKQMPIIEPFTYFQTDI